VVDILTGRPRELPLWATCSLLFCIGQLFFLSFVVFNPCMTYRTQVTVATLDTLITFVRFLDQRGNTGNRLSQVIIDKGKVTTSVLPDSISSMHSLSKARQRQLLLPTMASTLSTDSLLLDVRRQCYN